MAPPKRVKKVMTLPINVIFQHLQKKTRVRIWLYEDTKMMMEGVIIGFDEYMNVVLDDAVEVDTTGSGSSRSSSNNNINAPAQLRRTVVGRCLLKGDSITLIQDAQPVRPADDVEDGS